jgi:O-antigen/teichoic acid export membrane protein
VERRLRTPTGDEPADGTSTQVPADEHERTTKGVVDGAMSGLFGRDTIYLATWVLQIVAAAGVTPFVTRLLHPLDFGAVAAATAVMQVLFVLAGCGLQVAVQRWFAEPDGHVAAAKLLTFSIIAAVLITALAIVTGPLWSPLLGFRSFDLNLLFATLWAGASAVTAAGLALLRSHDKLLGFALVSLSQSVVSEGLSLGLLLGVRQSSETYLFGHLFAQVLAVLFVVGFIRPRWLRWRDRDLVRAGLRYGLPLVPAALGAFVLNAADRLMIQGELGEAAVARYQVAYNIGSLPMLILGALTTVWLPRFFAVEDEGQRRAVLAASRAALQRLLAPVMVGMSVASPIVLQVWAPPEFRPVDLMLVTTIIIISAVPFTAVQSATRDLLTRSATKAVAWSTIIAALANIGLNLVLIPVWGISGAASATFLAYGVQHGMLLVAAGWGTAPGASRSPLVELTAASGLALLVLLLPTDVGGLLLRAFVALVCLAWFGWLLRSLASGGPQVTVADDSLTG